MICEFESGRQISKLRAIFEPEDMHVGNRQEGYGQEIVYSCLRCSKCLRRDIIRAVLDTDHHPDWESYDREDIHEFLERKPLYYGHTFSYARDRVDTLPPFISDRLAYLPAIKSEWLMRVPDAGLVWTLEE